MYALIPAAYAEWVMYEPDGRDGVTEWYVAADGEETRELRAWPPEGK